MGKLIVSLDDSHVIKANIEMILEKAGYDNLHAFDGNEGISLVEKIQSENKKISLVLCDFNMPNLNGMDFLKWFKDQAAFKFIPVIMFTTEIEIGLMQKAKEIGASGWLIKPFEEEQLLDVIRKFAK